MRKTASCRTARAWMVRLWPGVMKTSRVLPRRVFASLQSASRSQQKLDRQRLRQSGAPAIHYDSSMVALINNAAGSIIGWMQRLVSDDGTVKSYYDVDTALLLGGILTVRQCFREDREIVTLAGRIYQRVDFRWMLNGHPRLFSHGWKPETGFLRPRWDTYSED